MSPNERPQQPLVAVHEPQGFWLHYTPMGIVVALGPSPPALPSAPQQNQNQTQQAPATQPPQFLPPPPFMIPAFSISVPMRAGQLDRAPMSQEPQRPPPPQQRQGGKGGAKKSPQGMGPLAPLPKATQDPRNPATLPSDYYSY